MRWSTFTLLAVVCTAAGIACARGDAVAPLPRPLAAQTTTAGSSPTPYDVDAPERGACAATTLREFGFWVGRWTVRDASGTPPATSSVTTALRECAMLESFVGADGFAGRSLNSFDAATGQWRQMWVDAGNTTLLLDGGVRPDGVMELRQRRPIAFNSPVRLDVLTWRAVPAGVVQRWEASSDDGATFETLFDATYRHDTQPAAELRSPGVCSNPARVRFFDFDFSLGDWIVSRRSGTAATVIGRSTIARTLDGCLLEERFSASTNPTYESIGFGSFDGAFRRWHREYVDSRGVRVILEDGGLVNGAMVLTGTSRGAGPTERYRVTWTRTSGSQFVVRWERSPDGGAFELYAELVFDRA